jgi:hypothetical protein
MKVEYSNLKFVCDRASIRNFIKNLIHSGFSLYWNDDDHSMQINIRIGKKLLKLPFKRKGDNYELNGNFSFNNETLSDMLFSMLSDFKGQSIIKEYNAESVYEKQIMDGLLIKVIKFSNGQTESIFEDKDALNTISVSMEDVMKTFSSTSVEERIATLRLELDYELMCLNEAILKGKKREINRCKKNLSVFHKQMISLEM